MSVVQKPTIGRIVHYQLSEGEVRPAMVVKVSPDSSLYANLQVFTDGSNDHPWLLPPECRPFDDSGATPPLVWRTTVDYDEAGAVGTWHWPPRTYA